MFLEDVAADVNEGVSKILRQTRLKSQERYLLVILK